MKKPLKEMLKKIGGGHLLKEDKKTDDYSYELGQYIKGLRPNIKGWKFSIEPNTHSWEWSHPGYEAAIYGTWGHEGKAQVPWESSDGEVFGKPDKYKAKYDLKKDAQWYIKLAKKSIPKILKTAQAGNF